MSWRTLRSTTPITRTRRGTLMQTQWYARHHAGIHASHEGRPRDPRGGSPFRVVRRSLWLCFGAYMKASAWNGVLRRVQSDCVYRMCRACRHHSRASQMPVPATVQEKELDFEVGPNRSVPVSSQHLWDPPYISDSNAFHTCGIPLLAARPSREDAEQTRERIL